MLMNADSSRQEFKTRNGRTVFEGRGIEPDVESDTEDQSILEIALLQQGMYFDFATEYEARNESFDHEVLPDEVFEEFTAFLEEQEFSYRTDSEKLLEELREELQEVEEAENQLQGLMTTIENEKQVQFRQDEQSIRRTLFLELVSRYSGQSGQVEAGLKTDKDVIRALEFISNQAELDKLLSGE